jgi:hypothetical protein
MLKIKWTDRKTNNVFQMAKKHNFKNLKNRSHLWMKEQYLEKSLWKNIDYNT